MKSKLFIILLFSASFLSCEKEFFIDYPDLPPTLVVNCLFTNDSVFNIQVSKLQQLNDSTDATIKNAEVLLYEDDVFFENLSFNTQSNTYKSIKTAQYGKTYTVVINAEGFLETTATDKVPNQVIIDSANVYVAAYYDSWGEVTSEIIDLYFKNPEEENYYEVDSYYVQSFSDGDKAYAYASYMTSFDPVIKAEGILDDDNYQSVLIFNDKLLNENAKLNFMSSIYNFSFEGNVSYYSILRNISKDYYLFRKQWYKYIQTNAIVQMDGVTQLSNMAFVFDPAEAYTNVENGLGIFAAYTETTKLMEIKN